MKKSEEPNTINKDMKFQGYSQAMIEAINHQRQRRRLKQLNAELVKCFQLRKAVQNHEFGYFFKIPVDPYALSLDDYWQKIRRPIDLKSIKHKFFLNIYKTTDNFNQDMMLMFGNALYYNQNNQQVCTKIKQISTFYHRLYQANINKTSNHLHIKSSIRQQLSQAQKSLLQQTEQNKKFSNFLSRKQIKQLAKCLNSLSFQNRRQILKNYQETNKNALDDDQYVGLQHLQAKQVLDLLKLAANYKPKDFLTIVKQVRPSSEDPLSQNRLSQDSEESSFEIEDQV